MATRKEVGNELIGDLYWYITRIKDRQGGIERGSQLAKSLAEAKMLAKRTLPPGTVLLSVTLDRKESSR